MMYRLAIIAVFGIAPLCVTAQAGDEIRADRSETIRRPSGVERIYTGGVSVEFTRVRILADSARVREHEADMVFFGGISLRDSSRTVEAQGLVYNRKTGEARFRTGVILREGERRLSAREVRIRASSDQLEASGNVEFDPEPGLALWSDRLRYDTLQDTGVAEGGVRLERVAADTLRILSHRVRISNAGNNLNFSGKVQMRSQTVASLSDFARYRGPSDLSLRGNARLDIQSREGSPGDTILVAGERIDLRFKEDHLHRIQVYDRANFRRVMEPEGSCQSVESDSAEITVEEGQVRSLLAWGSVGALLSRKDGSRIRLSGERLRMGIRPGKADTLTLDRGNALYGSADGEARSEMTAETLAFSVREGELATIVATGDARCKHEDRGEERGRLRIAGDRVELHFVNGRLRMADADGAVRGSLESTGDAP